MMALNLAIKTWFDKDRTYLPKADNISCPCLLCAGIGERERKERKGKTYSQESEEKREEED